MSSPEQSYDTDAAIGRLTVRYHDNERKVACLNLEIRDAGRLMADLGRVLSEDPALVKLTENAFNSYVRANDIPQDTMVKVAGLLAEFHEAMAEKKRLEDCLRQSGLQGLIK